MDKGKIKNRIWLVPFLFLLHNLEEPLGMTDYLKHHFDIIFITK